MSRDARISPQDEGERVAEHERQEGDCRADLEGAGEDLA
jgi:hypothetical protein